MKIKEYIVDTADKLFCRFGCKSVSMDDIARQMSISKKTIYQHFADKDTLVNTVIEDKMIAQSNEIETNASNAANAVHEVFLGLEAIDALLERMNAHLLYDLQKYHLQAWLMFIEFKDKWLGDAIRNNLERGIDEGLYRADINVPILSAFRLKQLEMILTQPHGLADRNYSLKQAITEITEHYLFGIVNPAGNELINTYKTQYQQ